jgi:hypothetical protein
MSADRTSCIAKTSLQVSSGWARNLQQETSSGSAISAWNDNSFAANIGFSIPSVSSESGFGNFDSSILTDLDN